MDNHSTMTAEGINILFGAALSLLFNYLPGLKTKFDLLSPDHKRILMALLLVPITLGVVLWPCLNPIGSSGECVSEINWQSVILLYFYSLISNQSTDRISPKRKKKEVELIGAFNLPRTTTTTTKPTITTPTTTKTFLLFIVSLLTYSTIHGQQYNGTISQSGYTPPPNVWVQWCQMGDKPTCKSYQLNQSILWDGQSAEGKFGRYAGGDRSVQGFSSVPAVSGEAKGGEVGAALLFLLGHQYREVELWDFAFANPCSGFLCGCSWYERITGSRHPIDPGCTNESSSGDKLRPCPNEPVGCGRNRNNPCITADTDIPTDRAKQVACSTGSGRVGRWFKRIGAVEEKPTDKPIDKPIDNPTDTPTQPVSLICLVLKIDPTTGATTIEKCE